MIDDDDVTFAILAWPAIGPISAVLFVALVLFLAYQASENERECQAKVCDRGAAQLLEGNCVCVGAPK